MKIKDHYEKYWLKKRKNEGFFDYERNLLLPRLFRKGEKVLDLGSGDGIVSEYLQKKVGVNIIAADISVNALKIARDRGLKTVLLDAESKLPFSKGEFQSVFWGDNIEHLFEPEKTLKEIRRVLKNEGRLILSCPNMGYLRYRITYLSKGSLPDTEWTGHKPWAWSHIRFFNINILKDLLQSEGFEINKIMGVSKHFPDKYLASIFPMVFGMILVVEGVKNKNLHPNTFQEK